MACDFEQGSDQGITLGSNAHGRNVPAVTMTCWVKPESISDGSERWICGFSSGTNQAQSRCAFSLITANNYRISARKLDSQGTASIVDSTTLAVAGTAVFLAARANYADGFLDLFVNGVNEGSIAPAEWGGGTNSSNTDCLGDRIGGRPNDSTTGYFDGIIDDVRYYHIALSDAEIMNMFKAFGRDRTIRPFDAEGLASRYSLRGPDGVAVGGAGTVFDSGPMRIHGAANVAAPTYVTHMVSHRARRL